MDIAVLKVQKWLNKTYGDVPKFGSVPEDGHTGWATIYGLRKGLQYEFGISELDDGFGDLTIAACNENVGVLGIGYSGNIAMLIQVMLNLASSRQSEVSFIIWITERIHTLCNAYHSFGERKWITADKEITRIGYVLNGFFKRISAP